MSAGLSGPRRAAIAAALGAEVPAAPLSAPLGAERRAEIRGSLPLHPAPGTLALAVRELADEVDRLEAERHSTNEAVSDAAEALRVKDAAAELVAEYRVPTSDGKWLSVRREPKGDRWLIAQTFGHSPMRVWTGERWTSWGLVATAELWAYASADAALAEANRLAASAGGTS